MGKGGYTGGSTVIGPRSGWFSKPSKSEELSLAQQASQKAKQRAEAKAQAKSNAVRLRDEKRLSIIEYKQTPEYRLELAERKTAKKARQQELLETKRKFQESAKNVEVYVRISGKERLVKVGTKSI